MTLAPRDKIAMAETLLSEAFRELNDELKRERSRARGELAQDCWRLRQMTGELRQYFSQSGQDWFVDQVLLMEKSTGVFVDVGGYDGVSGSNTLFFEIFRGWTGLLVEPVAAHVKRARTVRTCHCLQAAVSGDGAPRDFIEVTRGFLQMSGRCDTYDPELLARVREHPEHCEKLIHAETRAIDEILERYAITNIDYLSIDTEGAELDIIQRFPFQDVGLSVCSIENASGTPEISEFMAAHDYVLVEFLGVDEIYCKAALVRDATA